MSSLSISSVRLGLILGDQLSDSLACLRVLNPQVDQLIMAEVQDEASYVRHHKQKIALIFSAMRHFSQRLSASGWQVHYRSYESGSKETSLLAVVRSRITALQAEGKTVSELVLTRCGEYRLQSAMDSEWAEQLGIPVTVYEDDRFFCTSQEFNQWAAGRKQLRMEYFYREMRRKTGLLMEADQPAGGKWNYDASNRQVWKGVPAIPELPAFEKDEIDESVLALVAREFEDHPGSLESFPWATNREQALEALAHFIQHRLPHFGDFQDAMVKGEDALFHSLLSPYINCGLLLPLEVCQAAEIAWLQGEAPLNAVEGFIRQILGWREYVRGIYWLCMPEYAKENRLGNSSRLPECYWTGETDMACMSESFRNTFENGYAHHIQRLMVTGNFAQLAGVAPEQICEWYLAVYVDAYDWVELPNTLGMVMHADGGYLGSKPYVASGNYIHKMSDYCRHCRYSVKHSVEQEACPFNALYWHYLMRHRDTFQANPRMGMMYRNLDRQSEEKKQQLWQRGEWLIQHLDSL